MVLTTLLLFVPQIQHRDMGRKNKHTHITDTISTGVFRGKERDLSHPNKTRCCLTKLLYLHVPQSPICLLQTVCAGRGWYTHGYKYIKTPGLRITCDWNTASDICRTGCSGMYRNALSSSEKRIRTFAHKNDLTHHQALAVVFPLKYLKGACRYLTSFSTWWRIFLALNPLHPYAMS